MKHLLTITICSVFLLFAGTSAVLAYQDEPEPPPADGEVQTCGECHLDYHAAWATGVHAIAYDRASFQDAWVAEDNDPACLSCHTTDYQPALGEYIENIQCEACHGHTPENHPPETFIVDTSADTCGDCHLSTFDEWEHSLHAFTDDMGTVGCATCHNPHGQTLRFDTVNGLCINCHKNNEENTHPYAETYIHVTHNEVAFEGVEVTCASCHMFNNQMDELHQLANHTMETTTVPCVECHETVAELGLSELVGNVDVALAEERDALQIRVADLEATLAETETEETGGTNFVQLTQGLIVGLGLGLTFLFVTRRRNTGESQS